MIPLFIDLQDGFSDDVVVIRVDNEDVFHKKGVSTDYSLGRADSVETKVSEGSVDVAVTVPSRSLSDRVVLEVATAVYLGVSIIDGRIVFVVSEESFTYY